MWANGSGNELPTRSARRGNWRRARPALGPDAIISTRKAKTPQLFSYAELLNAFPAHNVKPSVPAMQGCGFAQGGRSTWAMQGTRCGSISPSSTLLPRPGCRKCKSCPRNSPDIEAFQMPANVKPTPK